MCIACKSKTNRRGKQSRKRETEREREEGARADSSAANSDTNLRRKRRIESNSYSSYHDELPPFDSRGSLRQSDKSASITSPNSATGKSKRDSDAIRPLNAALQREPSGFYPEFSANAGERGRPMQDTGVTKIEQRDSAEDLMQSIRSQVLNVWETRQTSMQVRLRVPCNVREFMEKQFDGSNKSLGRVIVLSGTASRGQATTCSDYIHSNWPLRGPWLLDMLQDILDRAGITAQSNRPLSVYLYS